MVRALCAPLPAEAIKPHPTKDYLSSVKAIYVIERLNEVFGMGGWTYRTAVVECPPASDPKKGAMVVMHVVLRVPAYGIRLEQYGGSDNPDRGDAYKGAATDGLTKCASYLGIAMDVYKGGGPTKQNPRGQVVAMGRGSQAAADQVAAGKIAAGRARQAQRNAQPAAELAESIPAEYDPHESRWTPAEMEPPEELSTQLSDSLAMSERGPRDRGPHYRAMLRHFATLKVRCAAVGYLPTYYGILARYSVAHANGFEPTEEGRIQAKECAVEMDAWLTKKEASLAPYQETRLKGGR